MELHFNSLHGKGIHSTDKMKCAIGQITLPTFCGQNSRSVYNPQNMHKRKTQSLLNQLSVIYTYWWKGQVEEQTRKSNKVYATQRETLLYILKL